MRLGPLTVLVCAVAAACGPAETPPKPAELGVADAWVRLPAVAGRPAAAYFTLKGGAVPVRLISVASAKVATIELHEGGMTDGVMTMRKIDGVAVPAAGVVKFAPGGNHAMLFGVDPSVTPGTTLPLTLTFEGGTTIAADAKAIAAGDAPPAGGHAGH